MLNCEYCEFYKCFSVDKEIHIRNVKLCELTEYIFDNDITESYAVYPCEFSSYKGLNNRKAVIRPDWKFAYSKAHAKYPVNANI